MATHIKCFECGDAGAPKARRLAPRRLLKIVAAVAVAFGLMYLETWAIEQSPSWSNAYVPEPASGASNEADSPIRDTAGPVAVLH
jgi:hypothetical protein